MLVTRSVQHRPLGALYTCVKGVSTLTLQDEAVSYPKIQDLSFAARKERSLTEWRDQIKTINTVEEKLIKINMPRYWGYKVIDLGQKYPYNCLPATQHYTRTLFESISTPANNSAHGTSSSNLVDAITKELQNSLEFIHDYFRHKYPAHEILEPTSKEALFTQLVVEQVNRILINALSETCPHLRDVEVDYNPRHEAFWYVGGIKPPTNVVKSKKGRQWQKEMADDLVDYLMQYTAEPYLAVRHRHQLKTWREAPDSEEVDFLKQLPHYEYDPRTLGYSASYRHGTNIPGFWPGSSSGFGLISYQNRTHLLKHLKSDFNNDFNDILQAQAIQSSFSWLLAQANYNGFNTFSDLTYPMNTQTIITNGRTWSFYEYQLHTVLVHGKYVKENPRVNFCRGTNEMHLYECFNDHGKCIGINNEVVQRLMQFYQNPPIDQNLSADILQPYLNSETKTVADYTDEGKRNFLENTFKHMVANRNRHLDRPEIYLWEKIYKIDNKTRQLEAKRRFFELDINPWQRTLDQHQKVYIPKVLRPEGRKSKKKWMPTYYP